MVRDYISLDLDAPKDSFDVVIRRERNLGRKARPGSVVSVVLAGARCAIDAANRVLVKR